MRDIEHAGSLRGAAESNSSLFSIFFFIETERKFTQVA